MISRNSRYRREGAYPSKDLGRGEGPIVALVPHEAGELVSRREHRVVAGERLDQLAQRYYGDPLKYWLICDANDTIFPEDLMVPGRILRIPKNQG
jgi:nucleoid-associated protein YgaU